MNLFNIAKSYQELKEKNWQKVYWLIDLHGTILEGKFRLNNEGAKFHPNATNVLARLSDENHNKHNTLILWTSSHDEPAQEIVRRMKLMGINFTYYNCNPEEKNTELCDFSKKMYFNIVLDDKGGFEADRDWFQIEAELKKIGQW